MIEGGWYHCTGPIIDYHVSEGDGCLLGEDDCDLIG